jgi:hypothetical protein
MLTGTCHCGAVRVTVPRKPRSVTDCNCSICRRYGVLWAYYRQSSVRLAAKRGATKSYSWGRKALKFVRCAKCGCVVCWQRIKPGAKNWTGVNLRNFDLEILTSVRVKPLDGAAWGGKTH